MAPWLCHKGQTAPKWPIRESSTIPVMIATTVEINPKNIVHQLAAIKPLSFLIKYRKSNATDDEISAIGK